MIYNERKAQRNITLHLLKKFPSQQFMKINVFRDLRRQNNFRIIVTGNCLRRK